MTADGSFRARYPGPWHVEEADGYLVVRASGGARLAWVHYRDLPASWRIGTFYALDKAEALALANAIAALGGKKKKARR